MNRDHMKELVEALEKLVDFPTTNYVVETRRDEETVRATFEIHVGRWPGRATIVETIAGAVARGSDPTLAVPPRRRSPRTHPE